MKNRVEGSRARHLRRYARRLAGLGSALARLLRRSDRLTPEELDELLTLVGGPMKDVQCAPGCPAGEVSGWRVGPGVRLHGLRDGVADELAEAIRGRYGDGAAHAIRTAAIRRMVATPDGGADLLVQSLLPRALMRRGALGAWLAYPATGVAVRCIVATGGEGPAIRLGPDAVAALGLPVHEPMEARTLVLTTGDDAPDGFTAEG